MGYVKLCSNVLARRRSLAMHASSEKVFEYVRAQGASIGEQAQLYSPSWVVSIVTRARGQHLSFTDLLGQPISLIPWVIFTSTLFSENFV